ncbi:MAG: MFS transporter, partial [Promethearchaeota archaeon]
MSSSNEFQKTPFDKRIYIIFLIMFTEVLGFSIVMPLLPFLGLSLGLNYFQIGLIASIFSICQLFASPITGKISDRFGRKPVLIFSQISTLTGFILLGLASNVWLLIASRLVDGVLGSNYTVSQAYISDVTHPKDRTRVFSYSSAVFGMGMTFGPLIGGLLSSFNYSIPMFVAAGISLISIILVIALLPESLEKRETKLSLRFEDVIPYKEAVLFFRTPRIRGLLLIFFSYSFGFMLFISTIVLFAQVQIGASPQEVSLYFTTVGILRVLFQSLLINPLLKLTGEDKLLGAGILILIATFSFLIFTTSYWIAFIPMALLSFGTGVVRPVLMSKVSKSVKRKDTGSVMGVNNSLSSIAMIITPILGGFFIEYLPSQILPASSTVIFILIFVLWKWVFPSSSKDKKD